MLRMNRRMTRRVAGLIVCTMLGSQVAYAAPPNGTINNPAGQTLSSNTASPAAELSSGTINNDGTITGTTAGAGFTGVGSRTLNNTGLIQTTSGNAVVDDPGGGNASDSTYTNTGTIDGGTGNGVGINRTGGSSNFSLTNGGVIKGATGVSVNGAVSSKLVSTGTIKGSGGTAIQLGTGANSVTLGAGSSTFGNVVGGGTNNSVVFDGNGGTLTGDMTNIQSITKTGAGTFNFLGNLNGAVITALPETLPPVTTLTVSAGTLRIAPPSAGSTVKVSNVNTTINGGGTLLVDDGAELDSTALAASGAGSQLVIGSGGTGAKVIGAGNTSFGAGASFTVAANSVFQTTNLSLTNASGVVAGKATVSSSLTMDTSVIRVTASGIFASTGVTTLNNSFITVDPGGDVAASATYNNTTLKLNGTEDGNVTLGAGSLLGGNGTINGNVVIGGGATLSPGNSPGTINVNGNLTLASGSSTKIELTPAVNDLINVTGNATLNGTLNIVPLQQLRKAQTFTFLTAGSITGTFASIVVPSTPIQSFSVVQGSTLDQIVFSRKSYASFALSENERQVGVTLDSYLTTSLTTLDPLTTAIDAQTSAKGIAFALDQLTAEPFDVLAQIPILKSQQFASNMEQYLAGARLNLGQNKLPAVTPAAPAHASAGGPLGNIAGSMMSASMAVDPTPAAPSSWTNPDERWGGFAYGYGYDGDNLTLRDGAGQTARTGFNFGTHGGMGAIDRKIDEHTIVGLVFGAADDNALFGDSRGRLDGHTNEFAAYATWGWNNRYLDAVVHHARTDFNSLRVVAFPGFLDANRATQRVDSTDAYVGAGWMYRTGEGWHGGPTVSLQWTDVNVPAFTETGGASALTVAGRDIDSLRSQVGLRFTRDYEVHEKYWLAPDIRLRWEHEFADDNRAITAAFAGAPTLAFNSFAASPARDGALLGVSLNAFSQKNLSGFLSYDIDVGRNGSRLNVGRYGIALKF